VGGTGKTPMVELLVQLLRSEYRLAILSRGYRRRTRGFVLATDDSSAAEIGDEPLQLYLKFPGISIAVDTDRRRGITRLEQQIKPDLILLDDAFQHRRVSPDLSLLLTACDELYVDDYFLPTGNLRDSRKEARRADIIVVTKCRDGLTEAEMQQIIARLHPAPHQQVLFASLIYDGRLGGGGSELSLEELKDSPFTLLTGIANSGPLVFFLQNRGLEFEHLKFGDHHFYTAKELAGLGEDRYVLTTEKDYGRIEHPPSNLYYIKVRHQLLGDGLSLLRKRLQEL